MKKKKNQPKIPALATAQAVLEAERAALALAASRLNSDFAEVVDLIRRAPGKVIVTGLGKSGLAAQSLAATLCSLGTPAVFLHASEAVHGDVGVAAAGDVVILVSKSGSTPELVRLAPVLRSLKTTLIALVGNPRSKLAAAADAVLNAAVTREADPLGLAPTSSVIVTLALGHALAAALAAARDFTADDFARVHPSGQLGRNLLLTVADVMHGLDEVPVVTSTTTLREVVMAMTRQPLGAACVVDHQGQLEGLVTDGDIRRALQKHDDIRPLRACAVMTPRPIHVHPELTLAAALRLMEERPSQISVLPVVAAEGRCLGLLRLHDIYQH